MTGEAIVETEELTKRYAGGTLAVDRVSFQVKAGEVFGFLGPNGAGKTTTIMMLTTLIRPTSGRATVCGRDVVASPHWVRQQLGYVSQDVAVDESLTGWENLYLQGRLYHLEPAVLRQRVGELLATVELEEPAHRPVATYSGGMRKRLDIAAGLIHRPRLLFLDEPTLGLDIQTRSRIWEYIRRMRDEHGVTVFLTTHYMEEADRLCDRVAIIDHGRIVALDTPAALKQALGGDLVTIRLAHPGPVPGGVGGGRPPLDRPAGDGQQAGHEAGHEALKALAAEMARLPLVESVQPGADSTVQLVVREGERATPVLLDFLSSRRVRVESVALKRPTLDDVFLRYTGRQLRDDEGAAAYHRMARAVRRVRG
ncbi:MAG: ATP-binding cassette domain-containing protein [Firmicutes bacterium]|nr:ATP-binding cassette domain-containing protein [Bacillota bacterium]